MTPPRSGEVLTMSPVKAGLWGKRFRNRNRQTCGIFGAFPAEPARNRGLYGQNACRDPKRLGQAVLRLFAERSPDWPISPRRANLYILGSLRSRSPVAVPRRTLYKDPRDPAGRTRGGLEHVS